MEFNCRFNFQTNKMLSGHDATEILFVVTLSTKNMCDRHNKRFSIRNGEWDFVSKVIKASFHNNLAVVSQLVSYNVARCCHYLHRTFQTNNTLLALQVRWCSSITLKSFQLFTQNWTANWRTQISFPSHDIPNRCRSFPENLECLAYFSVTNCHRWWSNIRKNRSEWRDVESIFLVQPKSD